MTTATAPLDPNALGLDTMVSVTGFQLQTYRWMPENIRPMCVMKTKPNWGRILFFLLTDAILLLKRHRVPESRHSRPLWSIR
jgi:hypothetical protein